MSKKQDGGAAFPLVKRWTGDGYPYEGTEGMSLRDYFAGQALVGFMASSDSKERPTLSLEYFARCAYETADAMLEARDK